VHFPPLLQRAHSVWTTQLDPTTVCRGDQQTRTSLRLYHEIRRLEHGERAVDDCIGTALRSGRTESDRRQDLRGPADETRSGRDAWCWYVLWPAVLSPSWSIW
jgi:hypothetical protein